MLLFLMHRNLPINDLNTVISVIAKQNCMSTIRSSMMNGDRKVTCNIQYDFPLEILHVGVLEFLIFYDDLGDISRYLVICFPLKASSLTTLGNMRRSAMAVWAFALVSACPSLYLFVSPFSTNQ
jgi:hypothetical protein